MASKQKISLEQLLLQLEFATTQRKARAMVLAGQVLVNDIPLDKPGMLVERDASVRLRNQKQYVSRAAHKLEAAFRKWPLNVAKLHCLDVGAAHGGFTEVLLQEGVHHVSAVDVAYGMMHPKLRNDSRVTVFERTHIGHLKFEDLRTPCDAFFVDVSFISLRNVLPKLLAFLARGAWGIVLLKPQFEVSRDQLNKGVVQSSLVRDQVCNNFKVCVEDIGWNVVGTIPAPLLGAKGNQEYLLWLEAKNAVLSPQ